MLYSGRGAKINKWEAKRSSRLLVFLPVKSICDQRPIVLARWIESHPPTDVRGGVTGLTALLEFLHRLLCRGGSESGITPSLKRGGSKLLSFVSEATNYSATVRMVDYFTRRVNNSSACSDRKRPARFFSRPLGTSLSSVNAASST